MPALGAGIHVLLLLLRQAKTWMAGTSPAMTAWLGLNQPSALFLHFAGGRLRLEAGALARERLAPGLLPLATDRALRPRIPALGPVAERIAVPGLLDGDRRQPKLRPQGLRAFHELLLGQSERRHRALHGGVDQELGAKPAVAILRALHTTVIGRDVHVLDRIAAIADRPHHGVEIVGIDVLAHRDENLAGDGVEATRPVQPAPHFGARRAGGILDEDHRAQIR